MEAIREIKKVENDKITIELPDEFIGSEIEIIVIPLENKEKIHGEKLELLNLAESALKKDWESEEEDDAWQDL